MESWVNFSGKEGHTDIQPSTRRGLNLGTFGLGGRDLTIAPTSPSNPSVCRLWPTSLGYRDLTSTIFYFAEIFRDMGSSSVFFSCVLLCVAMGTCKAQEFVKMVWVEKPPYTTKRPGTVNRFNGILYDVLKTKLHHCADFESVRVKHESDIVKNVSTGEAVLGGPIVVKGIAPAFYNTLPFISTNNYPGADFITRAEPKEFGKVVTVAVLSTWPLLALTLLMTAIAGIIVWALVSWGAVMLSRNGKPREWTLFFRAGTSILSQRLLHKMTNSRQFSWLVFTFFKRRDLSKKIDT